ncbi:MAG: adenylosuccinate lyase, partial [Candidatus Heimdallarchaeota archaeon]|nr:adenylosuccinate lyase [Candidatus Heimdallarchaeota archaeon]
MSIWADRYTTEINKLFSPEYFLKIQLLVEKELAVANAKVGLIPQEAADEIASVCNIENVTLNRVREIEMEIHHEPMNIVMGIAEQCKTYGGYVHFGATSNDIMDTSWAILLKDAHEIISQEVINVQQSLINLIDKYGKIVTIARTHGQHAIPTTLGFKFANFLSELEYASINLRNAPVGYGKMSGAVGNYASFGNMEVEKIVMNNLGLKTPYITTQVVPRILNATLLFSLAGIASVIERVAKEIRHLQRTEIGELQEPFKSKQVGSSTMPQKRNPHKTERICGLARVIRANVQPSLENIPLEHERDISNSSVERVILPESIILTHYILKQIKSILDDLRVNEERIKQNLHLTGGRQLAERLMLSLSDKIGRQTAHEILNELSDSEDFIGAITSHEKISTLFTQEEISYLLDPTTYTGLANEKVEDVLKLFSKKTSYSSVGIDRGDEERLIKGISEIVESTFNLASITGKIGQYGTSIQLPNSEIKLSVSTDGVGSKILIGKKLNQLNTLGIDCVAMNVNDLLAIGSIPLAFVDYLAVEKLNVMESKQIIEGVVKGCQIASIPLLGGETAILPEIIREFDLAGTAIGFTDANVILGEKIAVGDVVLGITSSGIHSNGFTLARKVLLNKYTLIHRLNNGNSLGEELLKPTKIYSNQIIKLLQSPIRENIHGFAHITGGGFTNLHRLTDLGFVINALPDVPEIFHLISHEGVSMDEMFKTFNMGIGFIIIVPSELKDEIIELCDSPDIFEIGIVDEKQGSIRISQFNV